MTKRQVVTEKAILRCGEEPMAATVDFRTNVNVEAKFARSAALGEMSTALAVGECAMAVALGYQSRAMAYGKNVIAASLGVEGRAIGALGAWLVLVEHEPNTGKILEIRAIQVDGEWILPDVPYMLRGGEIVVADVPEIDH